MPVVPCERRPIDRGDDSERHDCMVCHERIKTDSPEIKKLAAYAQKNEEPPWVRVYGFCRGRRVFQPQTSREGGR